MNSKRLGAIGVAKAIDYFLSRGKAVFVPVVDTEKCDLVVIIDETPQRVEVKFSGSRANRTSFKVDLRTAYRNNSRIANKRSTTSDFDMLFVYTADDRRYLIPANEVRGKSTITVDHKHEVSGAGFV